MSLSNFNLKNIPLEIMSLLKNEAMQNRISVNTLILQIIEKYYGIAQPTKKRVFHDLDYLAGTWSAKDKKIFDKNIQSLDKIDKELWS